MEMEPVSVFSSYKFMANSPKRGSSSRSGLRLHGSSTEAASSLLVTSDKGGLWATYRQVPALSLKKRGGGGGGARCRGEQEEGKKRRRKKDGRSRRNQRRKQQDYVC